MQLEQLREAAGEVLEAAVESADQHRRVEVRAPAAGSGEDQVLLAYCFRWLWEHSVIEGGQRMNVRPLKDAILEAMPSITEETFIKRMRVLRGGVSTRLEAHGLITRTHSRSWRWVLGRPDEQLEAVAESSVREHKSIAREPEAPLALPASTTANGSLPALGERLTVVGLQLIENGDGSHVGVTARREDGHHVLLALGRDDG